MRLFDIVLGQTFDLGDGVICRGCAVWRGQEGGGVGEVFGLEADGFVFNLDGGASLGWLVEVDAIVDSVVGPRCGACVDNDAVDFDNDAFGVCSTCQEEFLLQSKGHRGDVIECLCPVCVTDGFNNTLCRVDHSEVSSAGLCTCVSASVSTTFGLFGRRVVADNPVDTESVGVTHAFDIFEEVLVELDWLP